MLQQYFHRCLRKKLETKCGELIILDFVNNSINIDTSNLLIRKRNSSTTELAKPVS